MPRRITLGEEEFEALVKGRVVTTNGVQLSLLDIGFRRLGELLAEAEAQEARRANTLETEPEEEICRTTDQGLKGCDDRDGMTEE